MTQLAAATGMKIRLIVFFDFQATRLSMSQLALLFDDFNLVFTQLASKLERNADEDTLINEMRLLAAGSNARQENPRRFEILLTTVLPPENKIVYFQ